MKRFNVSYVEVLQNGKTKSNYLENSESDNDNYGTISNVNKNGTINADIFHKLVTETVLPKVKFVEGNKVTKVSMTLIDGYDCYYTTNNEKNELFVCFTIVDIPKILPIRVLSELKQQNNENDSNMELRVNIGEILDKFHDELLNYRNENNIDGSHHYKDAENEIQDVIQIMNDNIDKFLERQERVSLLVDKTSQLNNNSNNFKRRAARIKERLWWQRMKNTTLLIFAIILCVSALFIFFYIL